MSAKKGKKGADKKSPKKKDDKPKIRTFDIELEVEEIGNMNLLSESRFFMDATFLGKPLRKEDNSGYIFEACCCGPVDTLNFKWILSVRIAGEEDLIDLSANPIVISWSTLNIDYAEEEIPNPVKPEDLKQERLAFVDLIELIKNTTQNIEKIVVFQSCQILRGGVIETWPNMPFVKYKLQSLDSVLDPQETTKYCSLTISFDYVISIPDDWRSENFSYDIGLILPLSKETTRNVICKGGKLRIVKKFPQYKIYCTLSNLDHNAKYTTISTNISLTNPIINKNCQYSDLEDYKLPELKELQQQDKTKFLSFFGVYHCMLSEKTFKYIVDSKTLAIELLIKKPENIKLHYIGTVNTLSFNNVDTRTIRCFIPFENFDIKKCPRGVSLFGGGGGSSKGGQSARRDKSPAKGKDEKGKKKNQKHKEESSKNSHQKEKFIMNSEGFTTCVLFQIDVDPPLILRKSDILTLTEMNGGETLKVPQRRGPLKEQELDYHFKVEVSNYVWYEGLRNRSSLFQQNIDNICLVSNAGDLLGATEALLLQRFNFSETMMSDDKETISDTSFVYLINKIQELEERDPITPEQAIHLKQISAMECFELDMKNDAEDFYLMNIMDTRNEARHYVFYAIYNLLIGQMQMCLECCADALKRDPQSYISYLLQAYVSLEFKESKKSEEILQNVTKSCPNFTEAWMALYIINILEEERSDMYFSEKNLYLSKENPYQTIYHDKKEISWKPGKYNDPRLQSIVKFIQWGCFQFAEIGLSSIIHEYGCDSYVYLYHLALIEYYKENYTCALQKLGGIKCETPNQRCHKLLLKIHCLLNMESFTALTLIKEWLNLATTTYHSPRSEHAMNLIRLKVGRLYLRTKKYKPACFYLKLCSITLHSFAVYSLLGEASYKLSRWDEAEECFKILYHINPFNKIAWAYLAIIYYRKNLIPQYKVCTENIKNINLDNEIGAELNKLHENMYQRKRFEMKMANMNKSSLCYDMSESNISETNLK